MLNLKIQINETQLIIYLHAKWYFKNHKGSLSHRCLIL